MQSPPYLHKLTALFPYLVGGLDVVVDQGLPDADGLLACALQPAVSGHQGRPDPRGAHVHPHEVHLIWGCPVHGTRPGTRAQGLTTDSEVLVQTPASQTKQVSPTPTRQSNTHQSVKHPPVKHPSFKHRPVSQTPVGQTPTSQSNTSMSVKHQPVIHQPFSQTPARQSDTSPSVKHQKGHE